MVRFLDVRALQTLVHTHGLEAFIRDLMRQLKEDFSRWEAFEKTPRQVFHVEGGVLELMPVCDEQYHSFKYVNGHPKNMEEGKFTVVATGQLSRVSDGYPLMVTEMTVLTALRTAATAALASDLMARKNAQCLGIIGTGAQSEFQVIAHKIVRNIRSIQYFDVSEEAMEKFEGNIRGNYAGYRTDLKRCETPEEAVRGADIVVICTACKAHVTVLQDDWVVAGQHINGLGGDCPGKTELDKKTLLRSHLVVEYFKQSHIEGEIQHFSEQEARRLVHGELYELVRGEKAGRHSEEDITVFDSVGFALEDHSVLRLTYDLAKRYNVGTNTEMIPQIADPKNLFSVLKAPSYTPLPCRYKVLGAAVGHCASVLGCQEAFSTLKTVLPIKGESIVFKGQKRGLEVLDDFALFSTALNQAVQAVLDSGHRFLTIGGDHSCAVGSWQGAARWWRKRGKALGLIWIDAHLDAHTTETSPSGNFHGMSLATLLGYGPPSISLSPKALLPQHVFVIGARDYEQEEYHFLHRQGVQVFYMEQVRRQGLKLCLDIAQEVFRDCDIPYGISFDMDALDPKEGIAVGTPVEKGLSLEEVTESLKRLSLAPLTGIEFVEYNPSLDKLGVGLKTFSQLVEIFLKQQVRT